MMIKSIACLILTAVMMSTLACEPPPVTPTPTPLPTFTPYPTRTPTPPTATPHPTPTQAYIGVTLPEIFELRDANKLAADDKYIGMFVRMEGTISLIEEDIVTITPIGGAEMLDTLKCKVSKNQLDAVIDLRKGEPIVITGKIEAIEYFLFRWIDIKPCKF